ncbi:MAG: hypothetical protein HFE95_08780 [Acutalibacter sp.]|jgi:iron complex transport system substrate-binding protein|nr:hypothetical protein [Acutalibacter sp.]
MKFLRFLALCLALCLLCAGMAACSDVSDLVSGVAGGEFPVEINGVTVSARPQRVAVLSPSLADVVLALNCDTQLAAGGSGCTQDSLRDLQKVDPNDAAAVQGVNPDLVLLDSSTAGAEQALRDAGLTVLNIAPATDRQDFERLYAQVSSALNGDGAGYDAGIAAAQGIFITLDDIKRVVPSDTVTTGCYLYDLDGSGVTGDMFGSTIMTYSGVTNAFLSLTGGQYDFDSLQMQDPSIIFCAPGLKEAIEGDSRFSNFQAVRKGKVVEMEPSLMERQGRTVVTAALEISSAAFPELLEENSMQVSDPTEDIDSAVSSAIASSALENVDDDVIYETLQEGDQGEEVLAMQTRLDELGYLDTEYDGHYGEYTAGCVREFQKVNGLPETGIADSDTQKMLYSNLAKAKNGNVIVSLSSPSPSPEASPTPESSSEPEE